MRILHVTTHAYTGAGRAAVRVHRGLRKLGVESSMLVQRAGGDEPGVQEFAGLGNLVLFTLRERLERALLRMQCAPDAGYRSLGLLSGSGRSRIVAARVDAIHLHWLPGVLSVADIGRLSGPVVWTFHDQWPACGAEHYTESPRPLQGYTRRNRNPAARGLDLDRWTWQRKLRHWKEFRPLVACPSNWLAEAARRSVLFQGREVRVIPNPIDTALYRPQERAAARERLRLPRERTLLLFGAWNATGDRRKGFQVLEAALERLAARGVAKSVNLVVFGAAGRGAICGFATHWMGFVDDEAALARLYCACDAFVLPSLQDNFPNTLVEAMSCGIPVAASAAGGIPDLVRDMETGLLAAPGDAEALAAKLELLLGDAALRRRLGGEARREIEKTCAEEIVCARYRDLYQAAAA